MTISPAEKKLRRGLAVMRFTLGYTPMSLLTRLLRLESRQVTLPAGVRREVIDADGVPGEWLIPEQGSQAHVLLYLHGGGFVFGWTNMHRKMVSHLAQQMGMRALAVDYRLAPKHPFPAALDDCVTAYQWLLKQGFAPERIAIAGDSAGGTLTLTSLLKLRADGMPLPAAGVCLSPATDLATPQDASHDLLLHPRAVDYFMRSYIADHDPRDPLLSPVYADLGGLPPLLIHAGGDEFLRGDAERIAAQARQAGVDARLEVFPRMWHVFQLNYADLPQGEQALEDVSQFVRQHVGLVASTSPA
jgi:monoterpene epsilon-lactone hydrolase